MTNRVAKRTVFDLDNVSITVVAKITDCVARFANCVAELVPSFCHRAANHVPAVLDFHNGMEHVQKLLRH